MRRFMKLGMLCSCFLASFFLAGLLANQEVQANHFTHPYPNFTDTCPYDGDHNGEVITWNPPTGTIQQNITVKKRAKILCFDHNLSGAADNFYCHYPDTTVGDRITIKLEWGSPMWQTEYWFCEAPVTP